MAKPYWETKTLEEMSPKEWEALCDGCGRCCLLKLEEEETGKIHFTNLSCRLLNTNSCQCADYANRQARVSDCVQLTPEAVRSLTWLPKTCAYRLVKEGKPLYDWHPLVSGRRESVHEAGVSVRGRVAASETEVEEEDTVHYIVAWPGQGMRRKSAGGKNQLAKSKRLK